MKGSLFKKGFVIGIVILFLVVATSLSINAEVNKIDYAQKKVNNIPPVADANGPYRGKVEEIITLDGSGSYDPDGAIVEYYWYWYYCFGDYCTLPMPIGYDEIVEYSWDFETGSGIIYVVLRVQDNDGAIDYDETTVIIKTKQSSSQQPSNPLLERILASHPVFNRMLNLQ